MSIKKSDTKLHIEVYSKILMEQPLVWEQILGPPVIVNSMSSQDAILTLLLDSYTMVLFAIPQLLLEEFHLLEALVLILMEWDYTS